MRRKNHQVDAASHKPSDLLTTVKSVNRTVSTVSLPLHKQKHENKIFKAYFFFPWNLRSWNLSMISSPPKEILVKSFSALNSLFLYAIFYAHIALKISCTYWPSALISYHILWPILYFINFSLHYFTSTFFLWSA